MQATCFELVRRGIGSLTHLRLTIRVGLEAIGVQRSVGKPAGREDRNGVAAPTTQQAMHRESLVAARSRIAPIAPVPVKLARAPHRTSGPV